MYLSHLGLTLLLFQLTAAMYEIHEIFFDISPQERMLIIAQDRQLMQEKMFKVADTVLITLVIIMIQYLFTARTSCFFQFLYM